MPDRRYVIYDVFTTEALAGNPLAVVLDCDGLDTEAMQKIAGEFNLSETSFVLAPERAPHKARVRIFTPSYEMPFAGHPTVGTAIALADLDAGDGPELFVLEENIGPVRCAVRREPEGAFAEFDLPVLSTQLAFEVEPALVGAALGLGPHEVSFENHVVSFWSAGVPYVTVPVAGLDAAARAKLDNAAWAAFGPVDDKGKPASVYVYCRDTVGQDNGFHARMFVPGNPSYEDPATGSAVAALSGAIVAFDQPVDGVTRLWIEQGIEMGRASRIRLEIEVESGTAVSARIGGNARKIAEGTLFV